MNIKEVEVGAGETVYQVVVRLAPEDAKRLDDIQKSLNAIAALLGRSLNQGVPT